MNPSAFDAFAQDYDATFTQTRLGQLLRQRVWRHLRQHFTAGQHVLELTCGTGEDAVWLAQQGVRITATDGAAAMVQATAVKAQQAGVSHLITPIQISLQDLAEGHHPRALTAHPPGDGVPLTAYDGAFSNFGGLNTMGSWRPLAKNLASLVKPGSMVILVVMGPVCPWEFGWHLLHGEWGTAVRRRKPHALATIGHSTIPIWYPSARRLRRAFAPWFHHCHTESLGLWLPPSYLGHLVERWPRFFNHMAALESRTASYTRGWGDHYILTLTRKSTDYDCAC